MAEYRTKAEAVRDGFDWAAVIEREASSLRNRAATDAVSAVLLANMARTLKQARAVVEPVMALGETEVNNLASAQLLSPPANTYQTWLGVVAAGEAVVDWVDSAFPVSGDYRLVAKFDKTTGALTYRSFTPSETATLLPLLDDLLAALP